jgi:hypothetical protein
VTAPSLQAAHLSGSGSAKLEDLSGDRFDADISGSGSLRAAGSVDKLDAHLSGSGAANLSQLRATDAVVSLSGSGTARVQSSTSLDATLSGSGDIFCIGHPSHVQQHVSGSGHVRVK